MTIGEIAGLATIIEAAFVVISVGFIWKELRDSNKLTRAANAQALVELSSPLNLQLIQDRDLAGLWIQGAKKYSEMDDVDQYRYKSLLVWWMVLHENIYYQWRNGLLDKDIYQAWATDLEVFVAEQRLDEFWPENRSSYQAEFATHVDRLLKVLK